MKTRAQIAAESLTEIGNKINISSISPMDVAQRIIDICDAFLHAGVDNGYVYANYDDVNNILTLKPADASGDANIDIKINPKGTGYVILKDIHFPIFLGNPNQALRHSDDLYGILEWFDPAYLNASGKLATELLPDWLFSALIWKGAWDAENNYPELGVADADNYGWFYIASTNGCMPGSGSGAGVCSFSGSTIFYDVHVGDWVVSNGNEWQVIPMASIVSSVFGRTGAVVAQSNDYTWAQINKAISDIADITNRSHANLQDIGVNTHAQIDTFMAAGLNADYLNPNREPIKGYYHIPIIGGATLNVHVNTKRELTYWPYVGDLTLILDAVGFNVDEFADGCDIIIRNGHQAFDKIIIKNDASIILAELYPGETVRLIADGTITGDWFVEGRDYDHKQYRLSKYVNANYLIANL